MCFQRFIYFACGHNTIIEQRCDATQGGLFNLKADCPYYQTRRETPNCACGKGRYYCVETADGRYLDDVHDKLDLIQRQLEVIHARRESVSYDQARFNQVADEVGLSLEGRKKQRLWHAFTSAKQQLEQERRIVEQSRLQALTTIREGTDYHKTRAACKQAGGDLSLFPAFVPSIQTPLRPLDEIDSDPPPHGTAFQAATSTAVNPLPSTSLLDQSQPRSTWRIQEQPASKSNSPTTAPNQPTLATRTSSARYDTPQSVRGKRQPRCSRSSTRSSSPVKSIRSRCRASAAERRAKAAANNNNDDTGMRRSTRIREKKIDYADRQNSASPARSASSATCEVASYSQRQGDGITASLRDLVTAQSILRGQVLLPATRANMKAGGTNGFTVSRAGPPLETQVMHWAQGNVIGPSLSHSQSSALGGPTQPPPSGFLAHGGPFAQSHNDVGSGSHYGPTATYPRDIVHHAFAPMPSARAPGPYGGSVRGLFKGQTLMQNPYALNIDTASDSSADALPIANWVTSGLQDRTFVSASEFHQHTMPRSLQNAPNLTPSSSFNRIPVATDPRKRKQPASSSPLPQDKHAHLSFPGRDSSPNIHATHMPPFLSSPPRVPASALIHNSSEPSEAQTPHLTPAPILAPPFYTYSSDPTGEPQYSGVRNVDRDYSDDTPLPSELSTAQTTSLPGQAGAPDPYDSVFEDFVHDDLAWAAPE